MLNNKKESKGSFFVLCGIISNGRDGMKNIRFESRVLLVLMAMLVSVYFASVYMYDSIESDTASGMLASVADGTRRFVDENEAVSVFLGFDKPSDTYDALNEEEDVAASAAAYIERYNEIFRCAR